MQDSIKKITKEDCFGCRSCEQTCPKQCISMLPDKEGFLYPFVNDDVCINCGLCLSHCPVGKEINTTDNPIALGLRLKDDLKLKESTSGGVFAGLADYVIGNGGIVFGCAFDEKLQARHVKAETIDELKPIKGSKYVTSNTLDTYQKVADILKKSPDKQILYTGTPCQISGLNSYLGIIPNNLITADIICHGVPSQKLFDKYIEWLSLKTNGEIIYYGFRDKDVSQWTCAGKTKTKTKTKVINGSIDPYYSSFMRGETYRHCCYKCEFACINKRPSDITMGDFWGIESVHPKFYSSKGISCCLINTKKGEDIFDKIQSKYEWIETTVNNISKGNCNLLHPTKKPPIRSTIYDGIDDWPINKFISKLYAPPHKRFIRYVISHIPESVKIFIKQNVR